MNKIYRSIWNATLGVWVAAPETARTSGRRVQAAVGLTLACSLSAPASAATLYWDVNGNTAGLGGTGTWDTTSAFWNTNPTGTGGTVSAWNNGNVDSATFAGAAGTVTLGVPVTANNLVFSVPGYTLNGSTLNLAGATPTITGSGTINSVIAGTAGLRTGGGNVTLTLGGANTFTGPLVIAHGTTSPGFAPNLVLAPGASLATSDVTVGSGAGGGLYAVLTNAGNNQMTNAVVSFNTNGTNWAYWWLGGTTQSVLGVSDSTGAGVIEETVANSTLVLTGSGTYSFNGVMRGGFTSPTTTFSIIKNGTGTQTLSGGNISYNGTTAINDGRLVLNNAAAYRSPTTVNSGATLELAGSTAIAHPAGFSLALNNGSTLNKTNSGYDVFGSVTVNGTVAINVTNSGANNQLFIDGASPGLTGSGTINLRNTGSAATGLTLRTGAGSFSGAINVTGGALSVGAGAGLALQNTALNLSNTARLNLGAVFGAGASDASVQTLAGDSTATVALGAQTLTLGTSNGTGATFAGVISGTGALVKTGTGIQRLSGTNTYTGATTINGGTLQAGAAAAGQAFGLNSAVTLSNAVGATLDLNGFNQTVGSLAGGGANGGNVTMDTGTLTTGGNNTSTSYAGVISGSGGFTKTGSSVQTLSGASIYTGATTINAGTLQAGAAAGGQAFGLNSAVALANVAGATLNLAGFSQTIGALSGGGAAGGNVTMGAGSLTTGGGNANTTFAGVISGTGGLTKTGSGAQTLSGTSTYTGPTTVNAGVLQAGAAAGGQAFGSLSAVTLANVAGATLDLNGFSQTIGSLAGGGTNGGNVMLGSATLTTGGKNTSTSYAGAVSGTGGLIKTGTGTQTLTGAGSSVGNANVTAGTLEFAQVGAFTATGGYNTAAGARTQIDADATLAVGGAFTQATGSALNVALGTTQPIISATTANLAGTLNVTGFGASAPNTASALTSTQFNVIRTTGGITGDFSPVSLGGATSPADYLTLAGGKSADNLNYNVGFGLTWLAGVTQGNGIFTLANAADTFNVDVMLANQAPSSTGWDGATLTKNGAGTLVLSAANTYTGPTLITAGTLQGGAANTFASSSAVNVAGGATLDLNSFNQSANNLTGAGSVTLGTAALTANNTTDTVFGGVISGSGRVVKTGAAGLVLTGDSTYTGGTTISAGTLQLGSGGTAGSIVGDVTNSGTLVFNRSNTLSYGGVVSGAGSFTQAGPGTTILTANHLYTGGTTIAAGTLQLGDGGPTGRILGDVTNNAALVFNRSNTLLISGVISGSGSVSQIGSGTTVLNRVNSYAGGTSISAGVLEISDDTNLGAAAGKLSFSGGTLRNTANVTTARATTLNAPGGTLETQSGTLTHIGTLVGVGALTKTGAGTLVLGADNTYTGGTTVSAGTLQLGNGGMIGSVVGGIVNNGSLVFNRSDAQTFGGVISGSGTVTKANGNTLTLTGANTYSGGTALKGGQITVSHNTALGSGPLAMDEGTTLGFSIDGLNLANAVVLTGTSDPIVDTEAFIETLSGVISGSGALTKNGSGTLVLSGANIYSGATTVAAGTLRAGATDTFSATSAHTVAPGATLDTVGFNQRVAGLANSGIVSLLGATPGSTLTSSGAYVGNAGLLRLGTALAGRASVSDRLVLDGPAAFASGSTTIQIANIGGLGALTTGNGIEVVSGLNGAATTAQTTKSAFSLQNGHVDAGAFEYRLYAADVLGAGENWYLRSTMPAFPQVPPMQSTPPSGQPSQPGSEQPVTPGQPVSPSVPPPLGSVTPPVQVPTYRAEVPLLAALPAQMRQADLAMLGNLHRRLGDETPAASDGAIESGSGGLASEASARRAWGRVVYADLSLAQPGIAQARTDGHVSGLQAGTDLWVNEAWHAGVYVGYLDGSTGVSGNARGLTARVGSNDLRSRFLGAYATWTDASGWYVDSVLQGASQRYDVKPDINPRVSGKGSSFTASVEAGKSYALNERWSIEPQAQLAYQHSSFDDLFPGGARVTQDANGGWIGRLGVRVKGDLATGAGRLQPYGRLNLYYASFGDDAATFIGPAGATVISSGGSYSAGEVAAGATLALTRATSLYGEIGHLWSIGGDATIKSSVQASLGVKVRW